MAVGGGGIRLEGLGSYYIHKGPSIQEEVFQGLHNQPQNLSSTMHMMIFVSVQKLEQSLGGRSLHPLIVKKEKAS